MDGSRNSCEIVPDQAMVINLVDGGSLHVAASCDSIQMFPDPRYTYLRYWDVAEGKLTALFLNDDILAELVDFGIPITTRPNISQEEFEVWTIMMGRTAMAGFDAEIDELLE